MTHDAIVVGSGAAGSFAAKELTEAGLRVLMLEAGPDITADDFRPDGGPPRLGLQLGLRAKAMLQGQSVQSGALLFSRQSQHLYVNDRDHPYSTPRGRPFLWIRGKQLGGRLHTYGRVLLRWSDHDFKAASRDGHGQDWPIGYDDLAPFYAEAERFLELRGCDDHVENVPAGVYAGPAKLTEAERLFTARTRARWPERHPIAWRYMPPNARRVPQPILAALATGRLTIRPDSIVRRVLTDPASGLATGVEYADRSGGPIETASAGVMMLCASTIETVRLMLNSAGAKHPGGLGNQGGVLGRYFMDQVPSLVMGSIPELSGQEIDDTVPADPFYGRSGGIYVPRFTNLGGTPEDGFARGFAFQGNMGRMPVAEGAPARFGMMGFGEMLPHADNRITLHPSRHDRWGVPIPHIDCAMHANEAALLRRQVCAATELAENAGFTVDLNGSYLGLERFGPGAFADAGAVGRFLLRRRFASSMAVGAAIHESGGARMGADPATSVLDAENRCWTAPNVYVTDASCFASGGCAGTTLTIMALTIRACRRLTGRDDDRPPQKGTSVPPVAT